MTEHSFAVSISAQVSASPGERVSTPRTLCRFAQRGCASSRREPMIRQRQTLAFAIRVASVLLLSTAMLGLVASSSSAQIPGRGSPYNPSPPNPGGSQRLPNQGGYSPNQTPGFGNSPGYRPAPSPTERLRRAHEQNSIRNGVTPTPYGSNPNPYQTGTFGRNPANGARGFRNPWNQAPSQPNLPGHVNSMGRVTFDPTRINQIHVSNTPRAGNPFYSGNQQYRSRPDLAQQHIDGLLSRNNDLNSLMSATDAARQYGLPASQVNQYRSAAISMAQSQIRTQPGVPTPYVAMAKFSLESNDMDEFRRYSGQLYEKFPEDKHSRFFRGIDYLDRKDWAAAERELKAARDAGVPEEDIAAFLKLAIDNQKWIWEYAAIVGIILGAWLIGLVVLYAIGLFLSKSTLKTIKSDPNVDFSKQKFKNRAYRFVIWFAGIYYFLSLPIALLLSIALPVSLMYGALSLPFLSWPVIAIVLAGGVTGVATAISGLKASFVRIPKPEIDHKLTPEDAPRLWEIVNDVADKVGTRPVDEIWLIGTADLAVSERGSFLKQLRDRGRRVLVLGTEAIDQMDEGAFRAILAHEYGHFQNRDTAGGDISMRVHASMHNFVDAIAERGKIRWWDTTIKFLRIYYVMFHRMTYGASRLQEVMADRVAVHSYGSKAFKRGLEHVLRRDLETRIDLEQRVETAMLGEDPFQDVQFAGRYSPLQHEALSSAYSEIVERTSSEHDTHPSPAERFSMAEQLHEQGSDDYRDRMVWDAFPDSDQVKADMEKERDEMIQTEVQFRRISSQHYIEALTQAIQQTPDSDLLLERARLYASVGENELAIKDVNALLQRGNTFLELFIMKAELEVRAGSVAQAVRTLESVDLDEMRKQFGELDPNVVGEYYLLLGRSQEMSSNWPAARIAFENASELADDSYGLAFLRGRMESKAGEHQAAVVHFDRVIELSDDYAEAHFYRGQALERMGKPQDATEDFRRAHSLAPWEPRFAEKNTKLAELN